MLHDANADVANKFVGQQGIAEIDNAIEDGSQAGEAKLNSNQPPEMRGQRGVLRGVGVDGIDNQATHGQKRQRSERGDGAKNQSPGYDRGAGIPDDAKHRRDVFQGLETSRPSLMEVFGIRRGRHGSANRRRNLRRRTAGAMEECERRETGHELQAIPDEHTNVMMRRRGTRHNTVRAVEGAKRSGLGASAGQQTDRGGAQKDGCGGQAEGAGNGS